jgi:cyanate permease
LDNTEKQMLTNLLRNDANVPKSESISNNRLSWRQMGYVFIDWRIYLYVIIAVGDLAVKKCLIVYLPSIIQDMGFAKEQVCLMIIPPYALACLSSLLGGYLTMRRNEHSFHLAFFLSIGILGFILMISLINSGKASMYISICIAFCGTFPALSILLSWLTNNVGGHTKRAIAVGFVAAMGQIGGIIMPQVRLIFYFSLIDRNVSYRFIKMLTNRQHIAQAMPLVLVFCAWR